MCCNVFCHVLFVLLFTSSRWQYCIGLAKSESKHLVWANSYTVLSGLMGASFLNPDPQTKKTFPFCFWLSVTLDHDQHRLSHTHRPLVSDLLPKVDRPVLLPPPHTLHESLWHPKRENSKIIYFRYFLIKFLITLIYKWVHLKLLDKS